MTQIDTFLTQSPLVEGLSSEQVSALCELAQPSVFLDGEALTSMEDAGSDLYVISRGTVRLMSHGGEVLGEAGPGDVVGEIAFLDGGRRTANAVAIGEVGTLRFSGPDLRDLMREQRELGFVVLANLGIVLSGRMRRAIGQPESGPEGPNVWLERH